MKYKTKLIIKDVFECLMWATLLFISGFCLGLMLASDTTLATTFDIMKGYVIRVLWTFIIFIPAIHLYEKVEEITWAIREL